MPFQMRWIHPESGSGEGFPPRTQFQSQLVSLLGPMRATSITIGSGSLSLITQTNTLNTYALSSWTFSSQTGGTLVRRVQMDKRRTRSINS